MSLKVKYGAKMSFNHADMTCVEEENWLDMGGEEWL